MDKRIKNILLLFGIAFAVGCTNQSPGIVTMSHGDTPPQNLSTSEAITPTASPSLTATPVPSATLTMEPTATQTPVLPTWTPLPTLAPDQADQMVQNLLRHNAGCRFPCWWGIIPGITTWPEASHFLSSFTEVTSNPQLGENGAPPEYVTYHIRYPFENKYGYGGFGVDVTKDQIKIIAAGRDFAVFNRPLSHILSDYGPPNQIFLQTYENVPGYDFPLILILYYPDQNFLAKYELIAHAENDELVNCPSNENPSLFFWSEDEAVTVQRVQDWTIGRDPFIPMKPLDQVTDLTVSTFTEIFSANEAGENCIRTKKALWGGK